MSITTSSPIIHLPTLLINSTLPTYNHYLSNIQARTLLEYQLGSIFMAMLAKLGSIKKDIHGTVYDCVDNQYYWAFTHLINS